MDTVELRQELWRDENIISDGAGLVGMASGLDGLTPLLTCILLNLNKSSSFPTLHFLQVTGVLVKITHQDSWPFGLTHNPLSEEGEQVVGVVSSTSITWGVGIPIGDANFNPLVPEQCSGYLEPTGAPLLVIPLLRQRTRWQV